MNISGFGSAYDYEQFSSANRIIPKITEIKLDESAKSNSNSSIVNDEDGQVVLKSQRDDTRTLSTDKVVDFAVSSGMKTNNEMIGSDADVMKLDITKAISDMKKDSVLQEYQYFVDNVQTEDGIVTRKAM